MEPKKRSFLKRGKTKWEVDFGYDDAGCRRRSTFDTETEADDAMKRFEKEEKKHGEFWARLPPPERRTVVATFIEIAAAGLSLSEIWTRFKKQKEVTDKQAALSPKGYAVVVAEFQKRKLAAGKSAKYVKDMRPEEIDSSKALEGGMSGKKLFGWHDIDLENGLVTVRIEIAKTGDQRTIRLQPTAVAWLKLKRCRRRLSYDWHCSPNCHRSTPVRVNHRHRLGKKFLQTNGTERKSRQRPTLVAGRKPNGKSQIKFSHQP